MDNISEILGEREKSYGDFESFSEISRKLKDILLIKKTLSAPMRESLEMIMHKIARILNGDPSHVDSWQDIAGYAQLIVNQLNKCK